LKETIYTIPINEAFDKKSECPVCEFFKIKEQNMVEYSLGASMMEPDERIYSNSNGYCQKHTQMMYDNGNKLSHALVLETRLKYLLEKTEKLQDKLPKIKTGFLKSSVSDEVLKSDEYKELSATSHSCGICKRLEDVMSSFLSNILYLYTTDETFKEKFLSSKGFCINHFDLLCDSAVKNLKKGELIPFLNELCALQKANLQRMTEDIQWFTKKFDYRYKDEDWKTSKDAVQRACAKISGFINE